MVGFFKKSNNLKCDMRGLLKPPDVSSLLYEVNETHHFSSTGSAGCQAITKIQVHKQGPGGHTANRFWGREINGQEPPRPFFNGSKCSNGNNLGALIFEVGVNASESNEFILIDA